MKVVYTDKLDDLPDITDFCQSEFIDTSSIEIVHNDNPRPSSMLPTPALLSYLENSSSSSPASLPTLSLSSPSSLPTSSTSSSSTPISNKRSSTTSPITPKYKRQKKTKSVSLHHHL